MFKNLILIILSIQISVLSFGQKELKIELKNKSIAFKVLEQKNTGFTIQTSFNQLNLKPVKTKNGDFMSLEADGMIKSFDEGKPNIPIISKLIEIPQGAEVIFTVKSYDEEIINLSDYGIYNKIMPALRSQSKSEADVPFVMDDELYSTNAYFETNIVSYNVSGMLRASRLARVEIRPIQYNPVKNTLRILNNLVIDVSFDKADLVKTDQLKKKYASPYFDNITKGVTVNSLIVSASKELITQSPVHYVIVSDRMFEAQLAPFIAWKIKKGFKVTVGYTDVIGSTTTSIKAWLQAIYEGSDPMNFVLLVGDIQQIPDWTDYQRTDLTYCEYTGDNIPEVYYGRFSAQTTDQLQPQIDKTLMYEKYLMSDPSYLENNILVAGVDGTYAPTFGNGAINYGTDYYFNAEHSINPLTYLYADEANSTVMASSNSGASASILTYINSGVGFANYTAHCSYTGWADPNLTISDIGGMSNIEKYGLWIGNCCESVEFFRDVCFGEAALRKEDGGAIGYIGGTNSTYWDEDYWWGIGLKNGSSTANPTYEETGLGAYDGMFHDKVNEVNDINTWYPAQGQINMVGNLAVEASTSGWKQYYWEIYHLMGDPSLMPYMGIPTELTVSLNPSVLLIGMTSLDVTTEPYAYVALSQNGILIATAVADGSTGVASLTFAFEDISLGNADLVITAQNRQPYIGTILVTPADEPYIVLDSYTTDISPDFGHSVSLNVSLKNVAASGSGFDAANVIANISITDPYVTITDDTENYGTITADEIKTINGAFAIDIADNVPDRYNFSFELSVTGDDAKYTWPGTIRIKANAPVLTIGSMTIDDSAGNNDGILDAGETVDIIFETTNTGHADITNVIGNISSLSSDIVINTATTSAYDLGIDASQVFTFNITANEGVSDGFSAIIDFVNSGGVTGQYVSDKSFEIIIGFVPEYCSSYATSSDDSRIENVIFRWAIDNNTESDGCSTYSDFTEIEANVGLGNTYSMSFTLGTCESNYNKAAKVYIDWNRDGEFDVENETVYTSIVSNTDATYSFNVTIPIDAHLGKICMRIVCMETSNPEAISACGSYTWGETEDYTLNVLTEYVSTEILKNNNSIQIFPNPNNGQFKIYLGALNIEDTQVNIYSISGQKIYQNKATGDIMELDLTNYSKGVYFINVGSGNEVYNGKIILK